MFAPLPELLHRLQHLPDAAIGSAAGLATSVLWTGTSLLFTSAAKRLGVLVVNTVRICMAVVLLGIAHRLLAGAWLPDVNGRQVAYLAVSGLVGLAIGDQALFTAFVDIGPRLAMLAMTSAPLFAALFGWVQLGETLEPQAWLGMLVTLAGIAWVVLERPRGTPQMSPVRRGRGLLLAFFAAACQAGGFMLSKVGIGHGWLPREQHIDPQTAALVRMFFAAWCMLPVFLVHGLRRANGRAAGRVGLPAGAIAVGLLYTFGGAVVGPFLGMWLSLVAGDRAPLGVAQTLLSLPPVIVLPFAYWLYKEHISVRAVAGALLAVCGIAIMSLPGLWPA